MERARLLLVVNDLAVGGAQRVVLDQAAGLDRSRYTPEVASLEILRGGAIGNELEASGIPVHRLRHGRERPLGAWGRLDALIAGLRPDLVHTHLAAAGVMGRVSARRRGVRAVVSTLHNLSDWQERRRSPLRWLDRSTLGLADAIVAVSGAVAKAVGATCPGLAGRVTTIPNGVRVERLAGVRARCAEARAQFGLPAEAFVVGAVARLDRRKGLDTLVAAVARARRRVPGIRLLIVGDGPEREALRAQVRSGGLADAAVLVHAPMDVGSCLAAMDLFAAPSRTEGLGIALIESLAAGVPVLGSDVGGIPEVVADGVCGRLLPAERAEAWEEALIDLARSPERRAAMAGAAPAQAARFAMERSVSALDALYAGLLEPARDERRAA